MSQSLSPEAAADIIRRLTAELGKVIVGQEAVVEHALIALAAGGHALLEGVPGVAKTLLVSTIAQASGLSFNRIQFTPDLMPSDITGTELIREDKATGSRALEFVPGPIFASVVLADEINRTPPKTQAALLEAMQERQVTAGGTRRPLPKPFFVLATQNPIEQEGTYPLPEAQLDRFLLKIVVGYPSEAEELAIITRTTGNGQPTAEPVCNAETLLSLQHMVREVPVADAIARYALALVRATRRANPDLAARARFTCGTDFLDLAVRLKRAQVLVTSTDVICDPRFPRDELAAAAPALRVIHLIGAGIERALPLDWLPPSVQLTNNSGVHAAKAKEFMLMALLALNGRLPQIVTQQRAALWAQPFTPLARGRSVTVVGLGDMGMAAVRAANALGMPVTGVRREVVRATSVAGTSVRGTSVPGVTRVYPVSRLKQAVANADFVVIATPLTPQTRHLFDRAVFDAMKPGAALVNIGRGAVIDEAALLDWLHDGRLSGAILDVFDPEPLPADSPLWHAPNLIVHPHVSSDDTDHYMLETMNLVCRNVRRLLARRPLLNRVEAARGY